MKSQEFICGDLVLHLQGLLGLPKFATTKLSGLFHDYKKTHAALL